MMERVNILQPDQLRKLFSRYFNKVIKCNQHSIKTLIFLIAYCPVLPEYSLRQLDIVAFPSQDSGSTGFSDSRYAGKHMLLNWISPERDEEKDDVLLQNIQVSSLFMEVNSPRLISTLLFSLTVETNEKKRKWLIDYVSRTNLLEKVNENENDSFTTFIVELEQLTLQTSLMLSVSDLLPRGLRQPGSLYSKPVIASLKLTTCSNVGS